MAGCNRANSITWTATKCFGLPQQCAVLLMRAEDTLCKCYAMNEDYLFHDHEEKAFDLGEKTLNCGRRVDAFKVWLSLQVQGRKGFEAICDHAFDQAQYLTNLIKSKPDSFQMVHEPESLNVCFWFVPPSARNLSGPERLAKMGDVTAKIRRVMQLEGKIMVIWI
jgi:glutamate/tyrosine decarboxylase-like PLP-dependent enzyme